MSRLAPWSTPRVGSFRRRIRGSAASQRAMTTFCWLPPDRVVIPSLERPSLIRRRSTYAREPPLAGRRTHEARGGVAAHGRQREVLADGEDAEQRLVAPLARHVGDAGARRGRRRADLHGPPVGLADDAPGDAARSAQRLQERVLPLPLQPGEPDDLARVQLEVDPGPVGAQADTGGTEHDRARARALRLAAARLGEMLGTRHEADELGRLGLAAPPRRHGLARPHHGDPVADLLHLVHPVRDEDRAGALVRQAVDDREQPIARRHVERRRRLVEDEDPRPADQGARDAARLPVAERQLLDGAPEIGGRARELEERLRRPLHPLRLRHGVPDAADRSRARGCRGPNAEGRRAPPGRPRRSRGRAPPGASGSRPAPDRPPRSSPGRAGGRPSASSRACSCPIRSRP